MTTRHVVADDAFGMLTRKCWELERRVLEGTISVDQVCKGLQMVIEGSCPIPTPSDEKQFQTQTLWDLGFREALEYSNIEAFREAVPDIPTFPPEYEKRFDRHVLVCVLRDKEGNPDIKRMCKLIGVRFNCGNNTSFVPYNEEDVPKQDIYWMCCQDGNCNLGKSPIACRKAFQSFEVGMSVPEGLCLLVQDRSILQEHAIDLPGSIRRDYRDDVACLEFDLDDDGPFLDYDGGGNECSGYGSASRVR